MVFLLGLNKCVLPEIYRDAVDGLSCGEMHALFLSYRLVFYAPYGSSLAFFHMAAAAMRAGLPLSINTVYLSTRSKREPSTHEHAYIFPVFSLMHDRFASASVTQQAGSARCT